MCDRTKTEVLARNLAFEYFRGDNGPYDGHTSPTKLADLHWKRWERTAATLLEVLEKHND